MDLSKTGSRLNYEVYLYLVYILATFLQIHSATATCTCTDNKYREVTKTIKQNHAGSVLTTSSWNSKLGCASACDTSRCISFSFNSVTKECKTYGEEILYRDDGVESSSLRFYTKVLDSLNNCGDVPTVHYSGVYTLTPAGSNVDVFCDMDTAGGPWTIIASRYDGSVDFYKSWNEYKNGFGCLTGEFWLGFENVRLLLAQNMKLRIEMEGWSGPLKHVEYDTFDISDEASEFTLTIGGYSSPDGLYDALDYHNGRPFSTYDNDNDSGVKSCAMRAHGAWWYDNCFYCNLFGKYMTNRMFPSMVWRYFYANGTTSPAVKTVRMMLKKKCKTT